jgi:cobalt-zinc-cadmium efflux system membrane fusion protein
MDREVGCSYRAPWLDQEMKNRIPLSRSALVVGAAVVLLLFAVLFLRPGSGQPPQHNPTLNTAASSNALQAEATVDLAPSQLDAIKIEPVGTYRFALEIEAVGTISFVDDLSVQVFPPVQGKIIATFVELGDSVEKGQPLYTIDSPDLIQAESTLISAAATMDLTSKELARAKDLFGTNGVSEREIEQATSEQHTAEGALKAARDAVRVFGKTEPEIDQIAEARKIDPALVVRSPVSGQVTFKVAPAGVLVQPGTAPAPFSVADTSVKWMLANVPESNSPLFREGQSVEAKVMAYPGRVFEGKISRIYAAIDSNTHRLTIRSEIADPNHELRPGMLANFVIRVQEPVEALAIPMAGVVRNGDGTMAAWVTSDRRRFTQRIIKVGRQKDGRYEVLDGLERGQLAVTDGAIFLSNMLQAPPSD